MIQALIQLTRFSCRTNTLLEKVASAVDQSAFYSALWGSLLTSPAVRLPGITYVLSHLNRKLSMEDQLYIIGSDIELIITINPRTFIAYFQVSLENLFLIFKTYFQFYGVQHCLKLTEKMRERLAVLQDMRNHLDKRQPISNSLETLKAELEQLEVSKVFFVLVQWWVVGIAVRF